jgi:hypothetical protein
MCFILTVSDVCIGVKDLSLIEEAFQKPPCGYTPIADTLIKVLQDSRSSLGEKKLLIIIATDGQPTTRDGCVDIKGLESVMNNRHPIERIHTTFVVCTDDDSTMKYLNEWDEKMPHVDVVDDYVSERKEVQKAQGEKFLFTKGDYIVKILLGSIDPEIDALDEKKSILNDCVIS